MFERTCFRGAFHRYRDQDARALLSLVDIHTYMVDDVLTKVDRASLAVSLEVRVPLLDHRVVAFAVGLPASYRAGDGSEPGRRPLRAIAHDYVPPGLLERRKQGFSVPVGSWLRAP